MRIGLLADLHANREAVEACVEALQALACRRWVVLGDLVGYGADPAWVVDWAGEQVAAGAIAVLGNHDQAVIAGDLLSMSPAIGAATAWTRSELDARMPGRQANGRMSPIAWRRPAACSPRRRG